ncbi:hypothetical protein KSX_65580 [Ktedonospora formicarum]|uniref:Uncharacterized protein n=1 Tax=Ktedonospora formicarum TaxID=2778364 RepID=A0A8J3MXB8_9CHLR|nr:hypothetical protein KSX_65580 [Ktedonospora formicarum]
MFLIVLSRRSLNVCNGKELATMLLCTKIKIKVSEQDAATFEFMQGKCRGRAL